MKKKAQSISINTIIVAAIALTVMVLVVLIFTKKIGDFTIKSGTCESNNGKCVPKGLYPVASPAECSGKYDGVRNFVCLGTDGKPDSAQVCCISSVPELN